MYLTGLLHPLAYRCYAEYHVLRLNGVSKILPGVLPRQTVDVGASGRAGFDIHYPFPHLDVAVRILCFPDRHRHVWIFLNGPKFGTVRLGIE